VTQQTGDIGNTTGSSLSSAFHFVIIWRERCNNKWGRWVG